MMKFAKIINEQTGLCEVGLGTDIENYKSIGMLYLEVEQSDVDNNWYLSELCPHKTEEQKLTEAKEAKYREANTKANNFLQSGEALFEFEEGKHIEATDGNIAKMTAYALAYVTGQLQPTDTVVWNTKEDETVELNQTQIVSILQGLGQVQAVVWSVQYPAYIKAIDEAETVEEVEAIVIDYTTPAEEQDSEAVSEGEQSSSDIIESEGE